MAIINTTHHIVHISNLTNLFTDKTLWNQLVNLVNLKETKYVLMAKNS